MDIAERVVYEAVMNDRDLQRGFSRVERTAASSLSRVERMWDETRVGAEKFAFGTKRLVPAAFAAVGISVGLARQAVVDYAKDNDETGAAIARLGDASGRVWRGIGRDISAGLADAESGISGFLGRLEKWRAGAVDFIAGSFRGDMGNAESLDEVNRAMRSQEVFTELASRRRAADALLTRRPGDKTGNALAQAIRDADAEAVRLARDLAPVRAAVDEIGKAGDSARQAFEAFLASVNDRADWQSIIKRAEAVGRATEGGRDRFFGAFKGVDDAELLDQERAIAEAVDARQRSAVRAADHLNDLRRKTLEMQGRRGEADRLGLEAARLQDIRQIEEDRTLAEEDRLDVLRKINDEYDQQRRVLVELDRPRTTSRNLTPGVGGPALAARLGGVTLATSSIRDKELGVLGRIAKATEQTAQVVRAAKSAGDGGSGGVAVFAP